MEDFAWKDRFSVNVKEMDIHHKKLFGYFAALQDEIQSGNVTRKVGDILNKLAEYSRFHFTEEEQLMKTMSHPGLAAQLSQHAYFINEVEAMTSQFKLGVLPSQSVLAFMRDWFVKHIMSEDFKYGEELKLGKPL